jgi:hypothetical protein
VIAAVAMAAAMARPIRRPLRNERMGSLSRNIGKISI